MNIVYKKRNYTQGHIRERIKEKIKMRLSYRIINQHLGVSMGTISKRNNRESIESKSSSPITPHRKRWIEILYLFYSYRNYLWISIDESIDLMDKNYWIKLPKSTAGYYNKIRSLPKPKIVKNKFKEYDPWFIHMDISYWPTINWKKAYIYVAIDRATRLIYCEVKDKKNTEETTQFLLKAFEFFPFKIKTILTDNGSEFTVHYIKWKNILCKFEKMCKELWIEHRKTKPYSPRTNWMVEKANDTIKKNTIHKYEYETFEDVRLNIMKFIYYYNFERRHGWLVKENKWRTPYDALIHYYQIMPEIFLIPPNKFKLLFWIYNCYSYNYYNLLYSLLLFIMSLDITTILF